MSAALASAALARTLFRSAGTPSLNRRIACAFDRAAELEDVEVEAALTARYRSLVAAGYEPADALLLSSRPLAA